MEPVSANNRRLGAVDTPLTIEGVEPRTSRKQIYRGTVVQKSDRGNLQELTVDTPAGAVLVNVANANIEIGSKIAISPDQRQNDITARLVEIRPVFSKGERYPPEDRNAYLQIDSKLSKYSNFNELLRVRGIEGIRLRKRARMWANRGIYVGKMFEAEAKRFVISEKINHYVALSPEGRAQFRARQHERRDLPEYVTRGYSYSKDETVKGRFLSYGFDREGRRYAILETGRIEPEAFRTNTLHLRFGQRVNAWAHQAVVGLDGNDEVVWRMSRFRSLANDSPVMNRTKNAAERTTERKIKTLAELRSEYGRSINIAKSDSPTKVVGRFVAYGRDGQTGKRYAVIDSGLSSLQAFTSPPRGLRDGQEIGIQSLVIRNRAMEVIYSGWRFHDLERGRTRLTKERDARRERVNDSTEPRLPAKLDKPVEIVQPTKGLNEIGIFHGYIEKQGKRFGVLDTEKRYLVFEATRGDHRVGEQVQIQFQRKTERLIRDRRKERQTEIDKNNDRGR